MPRFRMKQTVKLVSDTVQGGALVLSGTPGTVEGVQLLRDGRMRYRVIFDGPGPGESDALTLSESEITEG